MILINEKTFFGKPSYSNFRITLTGLTNIAFNWNSSFFGSAEQKIKYDWGDKSYSTANLTDESVSHTYTTAGIYNIRISGKYLFINDINGILTINSNVKYFGCSNIGLSTLPSLNFNYLDCSNNNITTLTANSGLTYLNCSGNNLSTGVLDSVLNDLVNSNSYSGYCNLYCSNYPTSLANVNTLVSRVWSVIVNPNPILIISGMSLTTLPFIPYGVTTFDCSQNNLTNITLVDSITTLKCGNNNLSNLILPTGITYLDYKNNNIQLSSFPNSLTYLDCSGNKIFNIPTLPTGLTYLNCSNNSIYVDNILLQLVNNGLSNGTANLLTGFPPSNVLGLGYRTALIDRGWTVNVTPPDTMNYSNMGLTTIPYIPEGTLIVYCDHNSLTSIPTLPESLVELNCSNNNLDVAELERILTFLTIHCPNLRYVNISDQS